MKVRNQLHSLVDGRSGIRFPHAFSPAGAVRLAILEQLEESQWWPAERMRAGQMAQLTVLLAHAKATCPYYQERLAGFDFRPDTPISPEAFRELPILTRTEVQDAADRLNSTGLPKNHGWTAPIQTSGSTGRPIKVMTTHWAQIMWDAITMRDIIWHGRDMSRVMAVIEGAKGGKPWANRLDGLRQKSWSRVCDLLCETGPIFLFDCDLGIDKQLEWLQRVRPSYLLTYPSNLAELARHSLEEGVGLETLLHARAKGETLTAVQRALVKEAWGVEICDIYSANELGYIALQAPGDRHYLVQSEVVYLEVLNERGKPCAPGEIGRVVVTPLHAFATPLIRYDIGDYAEVGGASPCGRGLPVLERILGRVRNMIIRPDGSRSWPVFGGIQMLDVAPVRQVQVIQRTLHDVEARIVAKRPFTADQEAALVDVIADNLGHGFNVKLKFVDRIERHESGKFEDFRSEVAEARQSPIDVG